MPLCATDYKRPSEKAPLRKARPLFSSVADPASDPHVNGKYLENNPTWHVEYSPRKAALIHRLLERNRLEPSTICEVGCGAGEVLRQLQMRMDPRCRFWGYDIAPPAIEMALPRQNDRLHFELADFTTIETPRSDLMLILEVMGHVEDYLEFLRILKGRAEWKIFSITLDISVQSALRGGELLRRRQVHTHIHHFNRDTALAALLETGYEVVAHSLYAPEVSGSALARLAKPIRRAAFALHRDLAARVFGGYSLLVLAR